MGGWEIIPFEGLGNLRFGMKRLRVRDLLGDEYDSFRKGASSQLTDAYNRLGLHLHYDAEDRLEFIEAIPPRCIPVYHGVELMDDLATVFRRLAKLGYEPRYDNEGYLFDELGFALYAPMETVEGVSAYRRGYYDQ